MFLRKGNNFVTSFHERFCDWRLTIFLTLCLFLGGTSLGVTSLKIPLYYASVCFIGHALVMQKSSIKSLWSPSVILGGALIGLYCLYLLPLPPIIWVDLPGREVVVQSFELTDNSLPWLPLSLAPRATFESLFNFLPIIAR